eukprot:CAMPEP_0172651636 /NCGR_PEP_ID=MMETSP1068-20121228/242913_1 /TAXON_ID=35684 /ORGANISM="Pseudopedinella elastica, Strain CCMP716" /LENGTH=120 /DNA_ID=CAMNT_0013466039 /DNA_START=31 /DNA_END=394 /DNA_ORIENTATION=+
MPAGTVTGRDVAVAWLGGALIGATVGFSTGLHTGLAILVPESKRAEHRTVVSVVSGCSVALALATWGLWTTANEAHGSLNLDEDPAQNTANTCRKGVEVLNPMMTCRLQGRRQRVNETCA